MSEVPSVAPATTQTQSSQSQAPATEAAPNQTVSSEAQELAAAESAASQPDATKAERKAAEALRKKYDLKVNGKTKSVELDLNDDNVVQQYLQKAMASDEKFQEAATLRKDVQLLVKTLKENPLAILTHPDIGVDVKQLAQAVIDRELEDLQKSPEQKKLEELEKKLKDEQDARQKIEEEKRQAELARREEEQFRQIDTDITDALRGTDLPKVPYVVKRISDTMIAAFDMGYRDVTVKDIMPIVEKQLKEEMGQWFDSSSEDALEKLMGKNLDRIRKKRLASKKAPTITQQIKDTAVAKPKEDKKQETPKRFEDLFGKF